MLDNLLSNVREFKKLSFEQKQVVLDDIKLITNFLLILPDSPETSFFSNLDKLVSMVRSMQLAGDDKIFFIDVLQCAIYYLAAQYQDKLPIRAKNVKSNDQLYKTAEYKQAILDKLMAYFEELYLTLDEVKTDKTVSLLPEATHLMMRVINTLAVNFKEIPVINKTVKLCLTYAGECIKEIKSKGDKRRTVRHLKRTIRECFLEDNPKLNKLAASLYSFFDE